MTYPEALKEAVEASLKFCHFHIGQRVRLADGTVLLEVTGIRRSDKGYYSFECKLADMEVNRKWWFYADRLVAEKRYKWLTVVK